MNKLQLKKVSNAKDYDLTYEEVLARVNNEDGDERYDKFDEESQEEYEYGEETDDGEEWAGDKESDNRDVKRNQRLIQELIDKQ